MAKEQLDESTELLRLLFNSNHAFLDEEGDFILGRNAQEWDGKIPEPELITRIRKHLWSKGIRIKRHMMPPSKKEVRS